MNRIAIFLIAQYQKLFSPNKGAWGGGIPVCRFYPSCSEYAHESFRHHSFLRASFYSVKRIIRCNPLFVGGYDPPPKA